MKSRCLPTLLLAGLTAAGLAATDGTLGPTSTGSFTVTATVQQAIDPSQARISGLDDFIFGDLPTDQSTLVYDEFCIYHPTGMARIRVTQPNRDPSEKLGLSGPGGVIDAIGMYAFLFPDASDYGSYLSTANQGLLAPRTFNKTSPDCSSGKMSRLGIELRPSASAPQGGYQGTLQLTIEPE